MKHIKENSVWKKVYKSYRVDDKRYTCFYTVRFFTWERIKKDDRPIEERRAERTRKGT